MRCKCYLHVLINPDTRMVEGAEVNDDPFPIISGKFRSAIFFTTTGETPEIALAKMKKGVHSSSYFAWIRAFLPASFFQINKRGSTLRLPEG